MTRHLSMSKLHIATACQYWLRDDVEHTRNAPSYAARAGSAFHLAAESYPNEPEWDVIYDRYDVNGKRMREVLHASYGHWRKYAARVYTPGYMAEVALGYDPLTGVGRVLIGADRNTALDHRAARPGEWTGVVDALRPRDGWFADWKTGARPYPNPRDVPQMWGLAVMIAAAYGLPTTHGHLVQVGESGVTESSFRFTAEHAAEMRRIALAMTPDAEPAPGEHCRYCPARQGCPAQIQETPIMPAAPVSNIRPLRRGPLAAPLRVVLYGPDKVGKSTFASGAPAPVFLCAENGTEHLDVVALPEPRSWAEVLSSIERVAIDPELADRRTLVIDPINWFERFAFASVCEAAGKKDIEEVGGGFQKGYVAAVALWQTLIDALEVLRTVRKMHIIVVAHCVVKNQKNPEGSDFDRYQMALDHRAAAKFRQWADAILFATNEFVVAKDGGKNKGRSTGARVIHSEWSAAWDGGNRLNLPAELPLSWAEFFSAVEDGRARASAIVGEIRALATELGVVEKAEGYMAAAANDVGKLNEILNALKAKVA